MTRFLTIFPDYLLFEGYAVSFDDYILYHFDPSFPDSAENSAELFEWLKFR